MIKINLFGLIIIPLHVTAGYGCQKAPIAFPYANGDTINLFVALVNVPDGYNNYRIQYEQDENEEPIKKTLMSGKLNENKTIPIKKQLVSGHVQISVELYNDFNQTCSTKLIYESTNAHATVKHACLKITQCDICVNFMKTCVSVPDPLEDNGAKITCGNSGASFSCFYQYTGLRTNSFQHWYQYKSDGQIIANVSLANTRQSYYSLKLEPFDYNSFINNTITFEDYQGIVLKSNVQAINYPVNTTSYPIVNTLTFSEYQLIDFSCKQYSKKYTVVQVAAINTTDNSFHTRPYDYVKLEKADKRFNGSILCCLMFEVSKVKDVGYIERRVEKKTLIIYESENIYLTTYTKMYIIITISLVVLILAVILCMKCKKSRKKTESHPTVELDTYACPNRLIYVELNHNQEIRQPVNQDETPYAEIAGVLKSRQVELFR